MSKNLTFPGKDQYGRRVIRVGFYQMLREVLLKAWSLDWQRQHHLEMFWSYRRFTESETLGGGRGAEICFSKTLEILTNREV